MRPLIFDIQRFSIHDGPGIRSVVFFKGCNLECPWCQNPESIALKQEIAYYPDKCTDNNDCMEMCSQRAISYNKGLQIDREVCATCNQCTVDCLSGAIRVIGKEYSITEVMEEVLRDADYYETSGGGVTFSGGEPTLHIDFIYELLLQCRKHGIHTNIETNGHFAWEKFQKILPLLDLIYFDIKIADTGLHKQFLKQSNEKILFNIQKLVEANAPVEFRIPLIPEYTANEENLSAIISLLKQNGVKKIHLLPYHAMGEAKAEKVCSPLPKLGFQPFKEESLQHFQRLFVNENIQPVLFR